MGYKVKEARLSAKMSQEELSRKSGVSRGTICSIENGSARGTTTKTLSKLAKALGTSVDKIFLPIAFNGINIQVDKKETGHVWD